jgi:hypothetical protein
VVVRTRQAERHLDSIVNWSGTVSLGPFSAPFHYRTVYCGNTESPDMTLIAAVWCPEGFAIAADGLQFETNTRTKLYNVQKIFDTPFHSGTGFAFACAGTCRFGLPQSSDCFDFFRVTQRITDEMFVKEFPNDPADYFEELGGRLVQEFRYPDDENGVLATALNSGFPATKLIFVGYAHGSPLWAELDFLYTSNRFPYPKLIGPEHSPRYFKVFAGSNTIREQMETSGKFFQPLNLSEATRMVHEYAQVCVDGNTSVPDCDNLGESVHVAYVTKQGFFWKVEPKIPYRMDA